MALGGAVRLRIDVDCVVGAGLQASFAADTNFGVKIDDPVGALVHRRDRANAHAGRVGAMVAARYLEHAPHVGEGALLDVLDPRAVDA
jgi:hypothetical protein